MKKIAIVLVLLSLISCKKENPIQLCGVWVIDKMSINNISFEKQLKVNTFLLKCEDNSAFFHGSTLFPADEKAKWKFDESGDGKILEIHSSVKIYNDRFKIHIEELETGQQHMILKSDKVYISAFKLIDGK